MTKLSFALFAVLALAFSSATLAGIIVYDTDGKRIEVGGRIQLQYANVDLEGEEAVDRWFFRRLRPYIAGTLAENWWAKIQFDFGEALDAEEVAVKDAYMRYTGFNGGRLTLGNQKVGFSRQFMTSSKYQQLISRGFAGDHNFGSPDRAIVLQWEGHFADKKVNYSAAVGEAMHDPNVRVLDFDSQVNNKGDWNEGLLFSARIDYDPLGFMKLKRGDFRTKESKFNVSFAGYTWDNDGDNNPYTDPGTGLGTDSDKADLDSATGVEVSAGYRGHGFSADLEFQLIEAETVDPTLTGGIYVAGETELDIVSLNAGYMLINNRLELAVAYETLDADGYAEEWKRTTIGLNLFVHRHATKLQLNHSKGESIFGVEGDDSNTFQAQAQFFF